jgi:hypothetical protein
MKKSLEQEKVAVPTESKKGQFTVNEIQPGANGMNAVYGISDERLMKLRKIVMKALMNHSTKTGAIQEATAECESLQEVVAVVMSMDILLDMMENGIEKMLSRI